jgi:hypothetical protein
VSKSNIFIALSESGIAQLQHFDSTLNEKLRDIYRNFSEGRCDLDQRHGKSDQS